ncbi:B3 domain-containing Os01g0723500-like [Olea europaea subsp. europaea]|uniref:B3 domain-containing Os01g0723500-like n=1 Tax=Olea europaea subsp. europaea TaxID=158383 RepID=A0A8S0TEI2_OLEEU|nr:B3 domain-containing Os01g0723500-like [Olea europaea subsp. europaea]
MEENLQAAKRFFKVMTRDFHTKLALPKSFCEGLVNVKKSAIIRSGKGSWKVKVSKDGNSMACFEKGWGDFVRQHELSVGDVVVFKHIGEMYFNAFVFDFTACEKEFDESLAKTNEGSNNLEAIKKALTGTITMKRALMAITVIVGDISMTRKSTIYSRKRLKQEPRWKEGSQSFLGR